MGSCASSSPASGKHNCEQHNSQEPPQAPQAPSSARTQRRAPGEAGTRLLDEADMARHEAARGKYGHYESYSAYRDALGVDSDDEDEQEGRPAQLIVDHVPGDFGLRDVNAWEGIKKLPQRRGVHKGVYPLVKLILTDWPRACEHLGRIRVLTADDLYSVTPASHKGAFGSVFTATLEDGYPVFLKGQRMNAQFAWELATSIYAFNLGVPIPALIGLYRSGDKVFTVQARSLGVPADHWFRCDSAAQGDAEPRSSESRIRFAYIAAWILSLAHRHSIIHNDIALRNFMCGEGEHGAVELIDFGLSVVRDDKKTSDSTPYIHESVPLLQCAPEVLETGVISEAGDVFQFGWMLVSLFEQVDQEGRGFVAKNIAPLSADRKAFLDAMKTQRPAARPCDCPERVWSLAMQCLDQDPGARPPMAGVASVLEEHVDELYRGLAQCGSFRDACLWAIQDKGELALLEMLLASCGCYYLNLEKCDLKPDDMVILALALQSNEAITTLELTDNSIGDAGVLHLAEALSHNNTLTTINLYKNGLGDASAVALARSAPNVSHVNLDGNDVSDEGAIAFAEALPRLAVLNLDQNRVGDAGGVALGRALATTTTLKTLILDNNDLGDEAAQALGDGLRENSSILALRVEMNHIGDLGAESFARALEVNTTCEIVNLRANQLSSAGAMVLAQAMRNNSTIKLLNVRRNPAIGEDALNELVNVGKQVRCDLHTL